MDLGPDLPDPCVRPPVSARWRRFAWGFRLPFALLGRTRRSPVDWAALRRVVGWQVAVTAVVGLIVLAALTAGIVALVTWARTQPGSSVNVSEGVDFAWQVAAGVVATLGAVEWLVIALSREHHEQLTRRMSLLVGVPPEDPEADPRIRLDLRWIGRRLRRWARGLRATIAVLPAFALISAPLARVAPGRALGALTFSWSLYWAMVLACAKSSHAWRSEGDPTAPDPWFVRWPKRVPVVRLYGRFVGWMSRSSFPPAREVEPQLWELLGLALARVVIGLPGVYALFRPTLPLAATIILTTPRPATSD